MSSFHIHEETLEYYIAEEFTERVSNDVLLEHWRKGCLSDRELCDGLKAIKDRCEKDGVHNQLRTYMERDSDDFK